MHTVYWVIFIVGCAAVGWRIKEDGWGVWLIRLTVLAMMMNVLIEVSSLKAQTSTTA